MRIRACEGSGHCCKAGPCPLSPSWTPEAGCSVLVWDPEANRYWCGLVLLDPGGRTAEALYIGAGCSSTLCNAERRNVR